MSADPADGEGPATTRPAARPVPTEKAVGAVGSRDPAAGPGGASGPGRRLRCAVRAADRPPGAGGQRLLRDRARPARTVAEIAARKPAAVILSGGPSSRVRARARRSVDPALFERGIPVFGICYGFQAMAAALGGEVARTGRREYGATERDRHRPATPPCCTGCRTRSGVWMSHGDAVAAGPARVPGHGAAPPTPRSPPSRTSRAGSPECSTTPRSCTPQSGQEVLRRFLHDVAGIAPDWTPAEILAEQVGGDPRPDRRRAGDLRAVRRRRLRRRRRASCTGPSATS